MHRLSLILYYGLIIPQTLNSSHAFLPGLWVRDELPIMLMVPSARLALPSKLPDPHDHI